MAATTSPAPPTTRGYGNNTETLHKVLKKDTGHGVKDKLKVFKTAHGAGKEKARAKKFAAQ